MKAIGFANKFFLYCKEIFQNIKILKKKIIFHSNIFFEKFKVEPNHQKD